MQARAHPVRMRSPWSVPGAPDYAAAAAAALVLEGLPLPMHSFVGAQRSRAPKAALRQAKGGGWYSICPVSTWSLVRGWVGLGGSFPQSTEGMQDHRALSSLGPHPPPPPSGQANSIED